MVVKITLSQPVIGSFLSLIGRLEELQFLKEEKTVNQLIALGTNSYLDIGRDLLRQENNIIYLSRLQVHILQCLAQCLNHPVASNTLIKEVWGPPIHKDRTELYVAIYRIRNRIEPNPHNPRYLISVKGYGYTLYSLN